MTVTELIEEVRQRKFMDEDIAAFQQRVREADEEYERRLKDWEPAAADLAQVYSI